MPTGNPLKFTAISVGGAAAAGVAFAVSAVGAAEFGGAGDCKEIDDGGACDSGRFDTGGATVRHAASIVVNKIAAGSASRWEPTEDLSRSESSGAARGRPAAKQ